MTPEQIQREIMYSELEGYSLLQFDWSIWSTEKAYWYKDDKTINFSIPKSQTRYFKKEKIPRYLNGEINSYDTLITVWVKDWVIEKLIVLSSLYQ